jgi:hypothetical protein
LPEFSAVTANCTARLPAEERIPAYARAQQKGRALVG